MFGLAAAPEIATAVPSEMPPPSLSPYSLVAGSRARRGCRSAAA